MRGTSAEQISLLLAVTVQTSRLSHVITKDIRHAWQQEVVNIQQTHFAASVANLSRLEL